MSYIIKKVALDARVSYCYWFQLSSFKYVDAICYKHNKDKEREWLERYMNEYYEGKVSFFVYIREIPMEQTSFQ